MKLLRQTSKGVAPLEVSKLQKAASRACPARTGIALFPCTLGTAGLERVLQTWKVIEGHEQLPSSTAPKLNIYHKQKKRRSLLEPCC